MKNDVAKEDVSERLGFCKCKCVCVYVFLQTIFQVPNFVYSVYLFFFLLSCHLSMHFIQFIPRWECYILD